MFVSHIKPSNSPGLSKINEDYIHFIKNNHNMIEKHFMNDFQHPYKKSLMKSHNVSNNDKQNYQVVEGGVFINKRDKRNDKAVMFDSIQTKNPLLKSTFKELSSASLVSRKHEIYNSLNFFRPSQQFQRQLSFKSIAQQKQVLSKQEIRSIIEQKNVQIRQQLERQKHSVSQIMYKNKHHSQFNSVNSGGYQKDQIKKLMHSEQFIGKKEAKNKQLFGTDKHLQSSEKKLSRNRYNNTQQCTSDAQLNTLEQKPSTHQSLLLPNIKNRSQSFRNQPYYNVQSKLQQKLAVVSEHDIIEQIHSRKLQHEKQQKQKQHKPAIDQTNNLPASINQLRKQFQQNSDAIKMYKKVEKNNNALKIRQINQKNLKSYYEYESSIVRNQQVSVIEEEQKKNDILVRQLKDQERMKRINKEKQLLAESMKNRKERYSKDGNFNETNYQSDTQITQEELFLKQISTKSQDQIKEFLERTIPSKKSQQNSKFSAQLQEELIIPDDQQKVIEPSEQQKQKQQKSPSPSKRKQFSKSLVVPSQFSLSKSENSIYDLKVKAYREFAFKIYFAHKKFTSMIIKQLPTTMMRNQDKFKVFIGKGNNSLLIKSLMKRRFWWTFQDDPKKANFVWTQLKINYLYEYQNKSELKSRFYKTELNTFDNQSELKKGRRQSKKRDQNPQEKQKKTVIFKAPLPEDDQMKIFTEFDKKAFNRLSSAMSEMNNPERLDNFQKRIQHFPQGYLQNLPLNQSETSQIETGQNSIQKSPRMHNHFQFNHFIGNKKALFYNLRYYYNLIGKDVYDIVPLTFHIRNGVKDPEYAKFLKYFKAIQKGSKPKQKNQQGTQQKSSKPKKQKNIWIIKPGENSNRGQGIQVFDQLYELNNILKKKDKHKNGQPLTYIVQKYLQRPLLYKNRKFDIRHYFLLTRMWGKMRAYFFGEGYIRTSSYEFDLGNVGDAQIHLTNDAIQKHCDSYGKYEEGNKLSYVQFQRYLDSLAKEENAKNYMKKGEEKKAVSFANQIYPQMREIATQAIRGCYFQMDPNKTQHNFQIYGMDFMIDKDYKVWLIQINTNPCLELSSKLLQRVIPSMVQQSFRLTLDIIYPPPFHYPNTLKHMMPDYSLQKLKFELIFDEDRDGKEIQELFFRQLEKQKKEGKKSIRDMLLGEIDEEDQTYENDGKQINVEKGGEDAVE